MTPDRPLGRSWWVTLHDSLIIPRFLAAAAARPADRAWLTLVQADGSEQGILPGRLVEDVTKWAGVLARRGLQRGERVAICLDHSPELYAAFLGAMMAGGVPSFFAPRSVKQKTEEQEQVFLTLLTQSGSRFLICDDAGFAALAKDHILLDPAAVQSGAPAPAVSPAAAPAPTDIAFIQYSSGTTGLKKGVAITHAMLLDQIDAYAASIELTSQDVICSWLPLYHDMGLITAFFLPLLKGVSVVALSPFDWVRQPALLLTAIARHRATLCWQPNFAYKFLTRVAGRADTLASVRLWINCSEPVLAESHDAFSAAFKPHGVTGLSLGACYAMAETVFAVTSTGASAGTLVEADGARLVSSGRPLPGVSIRILDRDQRALPENAVGEIAIRTPTLFSDYLGDVRAAFKDGHYLTGDTGFLSGGELYVFGRVKDIIIVAGRNLYPQDIEAVTDGVPGAIPGRCAAFGIPNDELGTESLVIIAESHETSATAIAALSNAIAQRVTSVVGVAPADVLIKPHMWLTKATSGKISRQTNRRRYLDERAVLGARAQRMTGGALGEDPVTDLVRLAVKATIKQAGKNASLLADDDSFFELGLIDSLSFVDLMLELEQTFGLPVPDRIVNNETRNDSITALAAGYKAAGIAGAAAHPADRQSSGNALVDARQRRLELSPQFADTDGVQFVPVPYIMYAPQPDYASPSANTDEIGFRLSFKNNKRLTRAAFSAASGEKGIILGNSVSWGTGTTHDTKVVHNVLNDRMPSTSWYSFALRQTTFTQERLAAELFAPLDVDHAVWISGDVALYLAMTDLDHRYVSPYPSQRQYEKQLEFKASPNLPGFEQRFHEVRTLFERELILFKRVFGQGARNLVFAHKPKLSTCGKTLHPAEVELAQLHDAMPGMLKDPKTDAQRALDVGFRKHARILCERHGITFIDMDQSPRVKTPDWLFVDDGHMNDAGHDVLAGIIMDHLR